MSQLSASARNDTEITEDPVETAIKTCEILQYMIDNNAKRLYGLRTQCSVTEEITQREIRELEVIIVYYIYIIWVRYLEETSSIFKVSFSSVRNSDNTEASASSTQLYKCLYYRGYSLGC